MNGYIIDTSLRINPSGFPLTDFWNNPTAIPTEEGSSAVLPVSPIVDFSTAGKLFEVSMAGTTNPPASSNSIDLRQQVQSVR